MAQHGGLDATNAGGGAAAGLAQRPTPAYDPNARYELEVTEVDLRRNAAGRMLKARIYQPVGRGPFPAVLDLHGGAWNRKDRGEEERMDRAIASSGLLVVAVDLTVAPEAHYPACLQDANWSVRWLKANAARWNGDGSQVGIYGSSSGGHVAEMLGMRPHDPLYGAIPLPGANVDATVAWVTTRSPISDPTARYENAKRHNREHMIENHHKFFVPWESMSDANPQHILDRNEKCELVPLLVMQGALDDNVLPAMQERFANAYRAAGGDCEYHLFEDADHQWVAHPGPQTDKAQETVKAFIARQLARRG